MTKPVTPLLYISHNKSELLELRKHVFMKDAHEGKDTCPGTHVDMQLPSVKNPVYSSETEITVQQISANARNCQFVLSNGVFQWIG